MFARVVTTTGLACALSLSSAVNPKLIRSAAAQPEHAGGNAGLSANVLGTKDGELRAAIERAVRGARRRLELEECSRVLHDFSDSHGRSLHEVLSALSLSPAGSLSRIIFRDGRDSLSCQSGRIAAFTGVGSRVVIICGSRFGRLNRPDAELTVIHELLHTLGLGERPPTPAQIDRVIARRCGP